MDTSNIPPRNERVQGYECMLKQPCSLGGNNQRLRLSLRLEVGHGVVLALDKIPVRRSVSFGGIYTRSYWRKFEKLNETSREQVELGKGKELSSTDKSIDNRDVEETQPNMPTGVMCVWPQPNRRVGFLLSS